MKIQLLTLLLLIGILSCNNQKGNYTHDIKGAPESEIPFNQEKWNLKEGKDYPYRDKMVNDIVYNDTIRTLTKNELLNLLGNPSYYRDDTNFLYYTIKQKRLFSWPLHTKTMVVKTDQNNNIEWIKIHE